jgi:hypothetical protein
MESKKTLQAGTKKRKVTKMKKLFLILILLQNVCQGKGILNAVDYGMVPGAKDVGVILNKLWTNADSNCVINLPPGNYNVKTPIVWTGKRFTCNAEQTTLLCHTGDSPALTFGADPAKGQNSNHSVFSKIVGLYIENQDHGKGVGILAKNANLYTLDHCKIGFFLIGLSQWVDAPNYSYFNTLLNCHFNECTTCIKQDGTPEGNGHGVQSAVMRIIRLNAQGATKTFFDFSIGGYNVIEDCTLQTSEQNPCILKSKGEGNNRIRIQFFESKNPYLGYLQLDSDNNLIEFIDVNQVLSIKGAGKNNKFINAAHGATD